MNPQTTRLNLIPGGVLPVVNVNQYDKTQRSLIFEIYDGPVPYTIPDGMGILLNGTKPDKTGFSYEAIRTGTNQVTANLEQQMTVLAGDVECELRFQSGGSSSAYSTFIHGTLNFILKVEKAALNQETPISETELPLIEQAVEIASNIAQYVSEAENSAQKAETAAGQAQISANVAESANTQVTAKAAQIDGAVRAANTAAQNAQDVADNVQAMADSGLFKGEKGDKGDPGENGVYTPLDGFFSLGVESDGTLCVYSNTDMSDSFEYDESSGILYYLTDDGT